MVDNAEYLGAGRRGDDLSYCSRGIGNSKPIILGNITRNVEGSN